MSSISGVGSSSNNLAAYQDYLARQQTQKQVAAKPAEATQPTPPATQPTGDVDHDGDSH